MSFHGIKSHREAGDAKRKEDESEKKRHHLAMFIVSMGSQSRDYEWKKGGLGIINGRVEKRGLSPSEAPSSTLEQLQAGIELLDWSSWPPRVGRRRR